ncbi:MAG: hypothetical protein HY286_13550 [Planctomycetes bacterium]|nr:hypothetical protein [Planctomycetota bacterium]
MALPTSGEPAKKKAPAAGAGAPSYLAILLILAAVIAGGFLRWPDSHLVDAEKIAVTEEARESVEAAKSLLNGGGLTIARGGEQKPSKLSAGESTAVALSYVTLGKSPSSPLYFQAILSTLAILFVAMAGWCAAGGIGGAAAAILMATWPDQIEATRSVTLVPTASFTVAAAACGVAFALRAGKGAFTGMLVAGIFAGLSIAVHPLFIVVAAAIFVASIVQYSFRALFGAAVGLALGLAPLLLQRTIAYKNPLVSAERFSAVPGMSGFDLFQGTTGGRLADWVGVDATALSFNLDKGFFEHLYQNPTHVALLALAALSLLTVFSSAARGSLALITAVAGGLLLIPIIAGRESGIPLSRATEVFYIFIAIGGGLGASVIRKIPVVGLFLALGLALAPAATRYRSFLDVCIRAPGLLAPKPAEPPVVQGNTEAAAIPAEKVKITDPEPTAKTNQKPEVIITKPTDPPVVKPPDKPLHPATAGELATVKKLVDGEGGSCKPSAAIEEGFILLNLRLDRDDLDPKTDAVRLSLKILRELPALDRIRVRIQKKEGATVSTSMVSAAKAKAFFEKMDDPFEARRARDWWPLIRD